MKKQRKAPRSSLHIDNIHMYLSSWTPHDSISSVYAAVSSRSHFGSVAEFDIQNNNERSSTLNTKKYRHESFNSKTIADTSRERPRAIGPILQTPRLSSAYVLLFHLQIVELGILSIVKSAFRTSASATISTSSSDADDDSTAGGTSVSDSFSLSESVIRDTSRGSSSNGSNSRYESGNGSGNDSRASVNKKLGNYNPSYSASANNQYSLDDDFKIDRTTSRFNSASSFTSKSEIQMETELVSVIAAVDSDSNLSEAESEASALLKMLVSQKVALRKEFASGSFVA